MKFLMICDLLCLPGLVWFLVKMKKKGTLNDKRWGLMLVSYLQLTAVIFSQSDLTFPNMTKHQIYGTLIAIVFISLILWVIVYPVARWIYREMFEEKNK
jgi:hypothetical protein